MPAQPTVLVLKSDALGRVERVESTHGACARRIACGGTLPLSGFVARRLLARERLALLELDGLDGVPRVLACERGVLERSWIEGTPLSRARELPEDFFDLLEGLVARVHARGVCHNDLHKEQNVLVQPDGRPALVDFQLASIHRRRGARFESRAREDLRHVEKHRRRYTRFGRGPNGAEQKGAGAHLERSRTARLWRALGKPLYLFVTRTLLSTRDGAEERRPSSGPWPRWTVRRELDR